MIGTGMSARLTKPKTLLPHPNPSLSYMVNPHNGKNAPKIDRRTVLAAMADAACSVNASTRYVWIVIMPVRFPNPMNAVPMMGTIQCTPYCAVHPYTKSPIGRPTPPGMVSRRGSRCSGLTLPLAICFLITLSETAPSAPKPKIMPMPVPR